MRKSEDQAKRIVINVSKSSNAHSYSSENLLQPEQFETAVALIKKHLSEIPRTTQRIDPYDIESANTHRHETIFVAGKRGAGKTSFVLSLLAHINSSVDMDVAILRPLDPNTIEEQEIFLATVVSNIYQAIRKKLNLLQKSVPPEVREKFTELSSAFRVIVPNKNGHHWQEVISDPEIFASEVLNDADSGLRLAHSFAEFVEACCLAIGTKALILPLDDIDTALDHGWQVLETIRKYLATPRLIILLSGDLDLYRMLVRKHQWNGLASLVKNEKENGSKALGEGYHREIEHLEEQYLMKLFPTGKRIRLDPINERVWNKFPQAGVDVNVSWETNPEMSLAEVYAHFCHTAFLWPTSPLDISKSLDPRFTNDANLIPANTRNFIRLLEALQPWVQDMGNTRLPEDILKVAAVFDHVMYELGVRIEDLQKLLYNEQINWLVQKILKRSSQVPKIWHLDALYSSDEAGERNNQLALILQAILHQTEFRAITELEYCFKAMAPGQIIEHTRLEGEALTDFISHLGFQLDKSISDVAARIFDYQYSANKDSAIKNGAIKVARRLAGAMAVSRPRYKQNVSRYFKGYHGKANEYGIQPWFEALNGSGTPANSAKMSDLVPSLSIFNKKADPKAKLVLNWFFSRAQSQNQTYFVNFIEGLAGIVDLMRTAAGPNRQVLLSILKKRMLDVESSALTNGGDQTDDEIDPEDNDPEAKQEDFEYSAAYDALQSIDTLIFSWSKVFVDGDGCAIPLPVLARAWERFTNNLRSLTGLESRYWTVGTMLERWSIVWLNALLIEEVTYRSKFLETNLPDSFFKRFPTTNIYKGPAWFFAKLEQVQADTAQYGISAPYTEAWLRCPFLLILLSDNLFNRAETLIKSTTPGDELPAVNDQIAAIKDFRRCNWEIQKGKIVNTNLHNILCSLILLTEAGPHLSEDDQMALPAPIQSHTVTQKEKNVRNKPSTTTS